MCSITTLPLTLLQRWSGAAAIRCMCFSYDYIGTSARTMDYNIHPQRPVTPLIWGELPGKPRTPIMEEKTVKERKEGRKREGCEGRADKKQLTPTRSQDDRASPQPGYRRGIGANSASDFGGVK